MWVFYSFCMQDTQDGAAGKVDERSLDPQRNAEDLIGDTAGFTGITTGSSQRTSAEPTDFNVNKTHLSGGINTDESIPQKKSQEYVPPEKTMSQTRAALITNKYQKRSKKHLIYLPLHRIHYSGVGQLHRM